MTQTYRTTDNTKWGAGKGADLTASEVDVNFWDIIQRLIDVEDNPAQPVEILSIDVVGDQMTITMTDASTFGPFTLPVAPMDFTGDFIASHAYVKNNLLVANNSLYVVLLPHTSGLTFSPNATTYFIGDHIKVSGVGVFLSITDHVSAGATLDAADTTNYAQVGWEPVAPTSDPNNLYDVALFHGGAPGGSGAETFYFAAPRALRLPAAGNVAQMRTPVTTATLVFKVQKNDVDIGTITFTPAVGILPSGGQAGTITVVQTDFAVGDRLSVQDPAVSDATASDLMVTFAAARLP
jgi:hypothetical protein